MSDNYVIDERNSTTGVLDLHTGDTVTVLPGGRLGRIDGEGLHNLLDIQGRVQPPSDGGWMLSVSVAMSDMRVGASGVLTAPVFLGGGSLSSKGFIAGLSVGGVVDANGTKLAPSTAVTNEGTIDGGERAAISLGGDPAIAATIHNTGLITGFTGVERLSKPWETDFAPLTIVNRGTIRSTDGDPSRAFVGTAVSTWNGSDTVVNQGRIEGSVALHGGNDVYRGETGLVTVEVFLWDGNDQAFGGAAVDRFWGGLGDDTLSGGGGNDRLLGYSGNDVLIGGPGRDVLNGADGRDAFVLDASPRSKANRDRIEEFIPKDDTIRLENKVFKALGKKTGSLKAKAFHIGPKAHDRDDRIVYDSKKGFLYYDSNGSGAGGSSLVAVLDKKLNLKHGDFYIV